MVSVLLQVVGLSTRVRRPRRRQADTEVEASGGSAHRFLARSCEDARSRPGADCPGNVEDVGLGDGVPDTDRVVADVDDGADTEDYDLNAALDVSGVDYRK